MEKRNPKPRTTHVGRLADNATTRHQTARALDLVPQSVRAATALLPGLGDESAIAASSEL
eukprot:scaffold54697_cov70-Phaeocystis_antarctica.AAC.3